MCSRWWKSRRTDTSLGDRKWIPCRSGRVTPGGMCLGITLRDSGQRCQCWYGRKSTAVVEGKASPVGGIIHLRRALLGREFPFLAVWFCLLGGKYVSVLILNALSSTLQPTSTSTSNCTDGFLPPCLLLETNIYRTPTGGDQGEEEGGDFTTSLPFGAKACKQYNARLA